MFSEIKTGWSIFIDSIKALFRKPVLLAPLLIVWVVYFSAAAALLFPLRGIAFHQFLQYILVMTLMLSVLMSFSFAMVLDMIKQNSESGKINFASALNSTFSRHIYKILPFSIFWLIIWLLFTFIESIVGGKQSRDAMLNLVTNPFKVTRIRSLLRALMKAVRMVIFLAFPAIVWEGKGIISSIGRGYRILKSHFVEMATAYVVTGFSGVLLGIPPFLVYYFALDYYTSTTSIIITWLYIWFAWSFTIYLEQLFVAGLYMRHLAWEQSGGKKKFEEIKQSLV